MKVYCQRVVVPKKTLIYMKFGSYFLAMSMTAVHNRSCAWVGGLLLLSLVLIVGVVTHSRVAGQFGLWNRDGGRGGGL